MIVYNFSFVKHLVIKSTLVGLVIFTYSNLVAQRPYNTNAFIDKAEALATQNPNSAIYYLKKGIEQYTKEKDTLNLINSLCGLSTLYEHILDYGNAYDGYWEALILADLSNDAISKAKIYQELGWLYNFYRREDEALRHFNMSLKLKKKLQQEGKIVLQYLLSDYFAFVNLYRINKNQKMAEVYLDSCRLTMSKITPKENNFYVVAELGYFEAVNGKYESALSKLQKANTFFEINKPSYLTIVNFLFGETYRLQGNLEKSIEHYKKSLKLSDDYNSHLDYKLLNYNALSKMYLKRQNYKQAFYYSNKAQELSERIFGRTSKNNKHLFGINDKYRIQKEKEKVLIKEQRIAKLENEERIWFLKYILMAVVVVFILLYGYLLFRNLRRKHKLEKRVLEEKRKLEQLKTNEIMELKNRELTSSALQLIEKEEFIIKLKENLSKSETIDVKTINRMLRSIQSSPGSNWKEFEARFTSINQSFYENIRNNYPELRQTDLKLCALIKLDFSSKEMSSLLGITIESVHTSRYRLRKKLGLGRGDNLADFIASI
ncbi:tetratricopeptide repeat protein [uncultured Maribacter sp.]|uniref:tetratricopeptide repeat protein n=1 Tax=uncultured Maribacter sp. TaxID=431308 RepID=UPI00261F144D|nr:tetratricopeptide repeat protein [uncultured Maribacter sp.]